ncbi:hypothetical protein [Paraburkholderia sp. BL6665CI2N2]|uniref:hypothetical protein n=1 Tax=Paraburkholderia sp. BL6665CI2N2 TaxID=1938806 RepID=UPI001416F97D|nr:hypothetical protein [Paraburkholderia sp. BL6665CI2N2]
MRIQRGQQPDTPGSFRLRVFEMAVERCGQLFAFVPGTDGQALSSSVNCGVSRRACLHGQG